MTEFFNSIMSFMSIWTFLALIGSLISFAISIFVFGNPSDKWVMTSGTVTLGLSLFTAVSLFTNTKNLPLLHWLNVNFNTGLIIVSVFVLLYGIGVLWAWPESKR